MFRRIINPSKKSSFFLFGARGCGKTTWLKGYFKDIPHLWIDLLNPETENELTLNPSLLNAKLGQLPATTRWVVIDEIQKIPQLLNIVHQQIESSSLQFALTGSSARKLKRGAANLLAGRAFVYPLFPLTWNELSGSFKLEHVLTWGLLPRIFNLESDEDKKNYLRSYASTYLSEEIVAEQIIRNLLPFRKFLPVAAQNNGQILNYAKISRDVGVDDKTIQSYYEILEDTYMGFRLYPYHSSFRKRLSQKPKFYFFDPGVSRSLARQLEIPLVAQTSGFGDSFEHFIILEFWKLCSYFYPDYQLTYIQTKDGAEVDLVIDRPGQNLLLIEIKSANKIDPVNHLKTLQKMKNDLKKAESYCLSQDPSPQKWGEVTCLRWEEGIKTILPKAFEGR